MQHDTNTTKTMFNHAFDERHTRRTVLKTCGAFALTGAAGTASARDRTVGAPDALRLFSEQAVDGALEVVTQKNFAYVATGGGLAVVDWRNKLKPSVEVEMDVPGGGVADVKVDGDLLAISSQVGSTPSDIGTHFYDISDPTDPQFRGTWQELPAGVHNHFLEGDLAYICREFPFDDSALKIVDVSDPTNPTLLSEWPEPGAFLREQATALVHDVYVQDGLAYISFWDAGCWVLDVSDPTNPVPVSSFSEDPDWDEKLFEQDFENLEYLERIFLPPGNAHYAQPSPDGDLVFVGAETFPGAIGVSDPDEDDFGGIKVFDTSDLSNPEFLTRIDPPSVDGFRTSHNFDVTANRLDTSWYEGGVRVFDITDPADPALRASYDPDGSSFWTAVRSRSMTVASDIGAGLVFLHDDRGKVSPPSFEGDFERGTGPGPEHHATSG
ncbi:LVIVD repeat-containing protein [Haloferax sp. S1W]|uniref:LVIVD repeat-containing protein n=1 Tax=Haloferax sp. S1W TaxID=3377110 RepID=UPI0037C9D42F